MSQEKAEMRQVRIGLGQFEVFTIADHADPPQSYAMRQLYS